MKIDTSREAWVAIAFERLKDHPGLHAKHPNTVLDFVDALLDERDRRGRRLNELDEALNEALVERNVLQDHLGEAIKAAGGETAADGAAIVKALLDENAELKERAERAEKERDEAIELSQLGLTATVSQWRETATVHKQEAERLRRRACRMASEIQTRLREIANDDSMDPESKTSIVNNGLAALRPFLLAFDTKEER